MKIPQIAWLCLLIFLQACTAPGNQQSELFKKLYGDGGHFRGIKLGDPLTEVKQKEPGEPRTGDRYGYVYALKLGEEQRAMVEYMSKDKPERIVDAMVVNVFLQDEGVTSELYRESEEWFREQYGAPEGNFGSLNWTDDQEGLVVTLRMLDDKKSFSLNFVPPEGF